MLRTYLATLAAILTWRITAEFTVAWGAIAFCCCFTGFGLLSIAGRGVSAWRRVAAGQKAAA